MKKLVIALIVLIAALCCLLPFVPKELFIEDSKSTDNSSVIISYKEIDEQKEDSSGTVSHSNDNTEFVNKTHTYIVNENTKKFHNSYCRDIKMMSPYNKRTYNCTRDELISKGYSPCKHCCP